MGDRRRNSSRRFGGYQEDISENRKSINETVSMDIMRNRITGEEYTECNIVKIIRESIVVRNMIREKIGGLSSDCTDR